MKFTSLNLFLPYCFLMLISTNVLAQHKKHYSKDDSLRGAITIERAWWDLNFYHLTVHVDVADKSIEGQNLIRYKVLEPMQKMQIDLQPPLKIVKVVQDGQLLRFDKIGTNAYHIHLEKLQKKGHMDELEIHYSGKPKPAIRAPWDGGFTWKKDKNNNDFIATSNQGLGASVWWPCKDHMYDEPDSMKISVSVPKNLTNVSNGRLRGIDQNGEHKTYHWEVLNPINNYGVSLNIAEYKHFGEILKGEKGYLTIDYYVLPYNYEAAKEQFKQVPKLIKAFEHWFGPYPFYEDGFKIVEVPYLGMEHQSCVTYGNGYENGYLGTDWSGTGWGLKWDYILIHESGHEWFANNITYKDAADMWIHESFTTYSEALYTEFHFGKNAGEEYVIGQRKEIVNQHPIIAAYDLNASAPDSDKYFKGANMLHTIRHIIDNDDVFRNILRGLNTTFYHQTVTSKQIEDYIIQKSGKDLQNVFDQYLRNEKIPSFDFEVKGTELQYKWSNCIEHFNMPIKVKINNSKCEWLFPTLQWKTLKVPKGSKIEIDNNFYVLENFSK